MAEQTAAQNRSLVAASLAAVGASLCCVGPLVLLMLGVGGAWKGVQFLPNPAQRN